LDLLLLLLSQKHYRRWERMGTDVFGDEEEEGLVPQYGEFLSFGLEATEEIDEGVDDLRFHCPSLLCLRGNSSSR
jgi:hypothetical protein